MAIYNWLYKGNHKVRYRNIEFTIKDKHFIHFVDPKGGYFHDGNFYGRMTMVRSYPEGCRLIPTDFAKRVIDDLYTRKAYYDKHELRIFIASKQVKNQKNVCD